ncbi:hypothetical protein [uncultured Ellagibacter sp.]|uniref:hypothetical protein n=1 Tax=uncultured Ellagibacter sp. TaxID=2137580 RepID=UPI0026046056|nr:hypothetical protein [uncultured Ellagibacter sp.]
MGNNVTWFHLECDIFGTDNEEKQAASPFLHNLSSILYMGIRVGVPAGMPSSFPAVSCIGRRRSSRIGLCASGVTHRASFVVRYASCAALRAAFASSLKTFSKKCLTEIAVLLI